MQVFFTNPANSSVLLIKNRPASHMLSESVEIFVIILCSFGFEVSQTSIILIIVVASAGTFFVLGAANLDKTKYFRICKLYALEHFLDVTMGG